MSAGWRPWATLGPLLLAAGLLGLLVAAVMGMDYHWRWSALGPHLISEQVESLRPPQAGTVRSVAPLQIELRDGSPWQCADCQAVEGLQIGAPVWPEDRVAERRGWHIGLLLQGLGLTVQVSLLAILVSIPPGLALALLRMQRAAPLRRLGIALIEIIRGTPLLVQIFLFYFLVGTLLGLERMTAGIVALSLFTAAYVAEIVRAAIESVPRGQWEAAQVLGLNRRQALQHVILPQALPRMLPALGGQFILLIKDSSLLSVIALTDLTKAGREIIAATFAPFEVWLAVAALYLCLTLSLGALVRHWERRFGVARG